MQAVFDSRLRCFPQDLIESHRLGWFRDCDDVAVALQAAYVQVASPQLRQAMLVRDVDPTYSVAL